MEFSHHLGQFSQIKEFSFFSAALGPLPLDSALHFFEPFSLVFLHLLFSFSRRC